MNKNRNDAVSDYAIYSIELYEVLEKIGKADAKRVTKKSGLPTRLHQQVRKLTTKHGQDNVAYEILEMLKNKTTKEAKGREAELLQAYFEATGIVPEGNKKSFNPK